MMVDGETFNHRPAQTGTDLHRQPIVSVMVRDGLWRSVAEGSSFRRWFTIVWMAFFSILMSLNAWSAPIHPSVYKMRCERSDTPAMEHRDGVGNLWAKVAARDAASVRGDARFRAPNQTPNPLPANRVIRIAAIPVQFAQDSTASTTGSGQFYIDHMGDSRAVGDSIRLMLTRADSYYRAVSYNLLQCTFTVFDSYMPTLPSAMSTYTADQTGSQSSLKGNTGMIRETLRLVDTWVNFGAYDALVIFHAGWSSQLTGNDANGEDIGAQFFDDATAYTDTQTNDTVTNAVVMSPFGLVVSGETVTMMGTFCHEFGHVLGLPDLYSTATGAGGIGDWGLMGSGNYNGRPQGDSPAWMDAWSRERLGWADTRVLDTDQSLTLTKAESDSKIYKIKTNSTRETEYFLLDVRYPTASGRDSVAGTGMLIWHIDNTMGSISNNTVNNLTDGGAHRRVDLEEADGSDAGGSSSAFAGTPAQPWPGTGGKTNFADNTTPSSRGYYDTVARFAITGITHSAGTVSFVISFTSVTVNDSMAAIKFPSSCVVGRALAPWPRVLSAARTVRDRILGYPLGRRLLGSAARGRNGVPFSSFPKHIHTGFPLSRE